MSNAERGYSRGSTRAESRQYYLTEKNSDTSGEIQYIRYGYGREVYLSYYRLDHLLPPEVTLLRSEINLLHQTKKITHKGMRCTIVTLAKYFDVWETRNPDFVTLMERDCTELKLPNKSSTTETSSSEEGCVVMPFATTEPRVTVHGGIGSEYSVTSVFAEMVTACRISASLRHQEVLSGVCAEDMVEEALWWLENDELFNCGYGSVVNNEGYIEMDLYMMDGTRCECGSVVAIRDVEHPISIARYVMNKCPNTIVAKKGSKTLAKSAGINWISRESIIAAAAYFSNEKKHPTASIGYCTAQRDNGSSEILKSGSLGAVGCGAWDGRTIVLGTSNGRSRGEMVGQVGDSSLIGCGTFADKYFGCTLTGHRESIIKMGLARCIVVIFRSLTPQRSYLQQPLEDPERDLPTNLRVDFNSMKVGYVTNPETLQALTEQCDIDVGN